MTQNWLGQRIEVGSIVGRNANEGGDTKIGRVFAIEGRVVKVHWLYGHSWSSSEPRQLRAKAPGVPAGGGPIDVDRLFLLDPSTFSFNPMEWFKQ